MSRDHDGGSKASTDNLSAHGRIVECDIAFKRSRLSVAAAADLWNPIIQSTIEIDRPVGRKNVRAGVGSTKTGADADLLSEPDAMLAKAEPKPIIARALRAPLRHLRK